MKIFTLRHSLPVILEAKRRESILLAMALVFACAFVACDSGSSSADPDPVAEISSSSDDDDDISSSSVTDKGKSSGGSSKSSSSVKSGDDSQKSSSSVNGGSCSSTEVESSSDSKKKKCEENAVDVDTSGYMIFTYQCKNGEWKTIDIYEIPQPASSDAHYDMTEQYTYNGRPNENMADDFTDPRDDQVYKTVNVYIRDANKDLVVAYRVFAENLNYGKQIKNGTTTFDDNVVEKYCYNDDEWYCDNGFGGMYTWSEAMGLPKACDTLFVDSSAACIESFVPPGGRVDKFGWYVHRQGICPEGWHVMNYVEWLVVGAEAQVRSRVIWGDAQSNSHGFSALPVGYLSNGKYVLFGEFAFFHVPEEVKKDEAHGRSISQNYFVENVIRKDNAASVRCVEDYEDSLWK